MTRPSTLVALVLAGGAARAQVVEAWSAVRSAPSIAYEVAGSITDSAGFTTVYGAVRSGAPRATWIARIEPTGALAWERIGPLGAGDLGEYVAVLPSGADVIACGSRGFDPVGPAPMQFVTVLDRYDAAGTKTPLAQFGTYSPSEEPAAATVDASGDVWIAGRTATLGTSAFRVLRYSALGVLEMSSTWDGGGIASATALATDAVGDVRVVGQYENEPARGIALVRFTAAGAVAWARTAGSGSSRARDVAVGAAGESYVAGTLYDPSLGEQYALLRFDADGAPAWQVVVSDATHPVGVAESVAVDPWGDVIVAGSWTNGIGTLQKQVVVQKRTASGALVWSRAWNETAGPGSLATRAHVDGGGNVYVAGTTQLAIGGGSRAFVLALDRDGQVRWSRSFGGTGDPNVAVSARTGPIGSAFVAARWSDGGAAQARVVRYDETAVPTCLGDGSTTACPCGNASPSSERAGCLHSLGGAGRLTGTGASSLAADALVLRGEGMTNSSALYLQGDGSAPPTAFGDGLRCANGAVVRLATRTNVAGASSWPGAGDPTVSVRGGVVAPGVRTYQVWYRNVASFCTPDAFNLTNGLRVTWTL